MDWDCAGIGFDWTKIGLDWGLDRTRVTGSGLQWTGLELDKSRLDWNWTRVDWTGIGQE